MKKVFYYLLFFGLCLFFIGCQESAKEKDEESVNQKKPKEELNMSQEELFDIYYLFEAPEANEDHDLADIIKVVFTKNNSSFSDTIAIDIKNNEIYIDPRISSLGIRARNGTKKVDDTTSVLNILEKYNVQAWKEDYTFEDPDSYEDGYGWNIWLQFEDGTVEEHGGSGTEDEITPENFDDFYNELNDFVEEKLGDTED